MVYQLPFRDIRHILHNVSGLDKLCGLTPERALSDELIDAILSELGKFVSAVLDPINHPGDVAGARLTPAGVVTAPGYKQAYAAYVENRWGSVSFPEAAGGQELPHVMAAVVAEAVASAALSFSTCVNLTAGAAKAILAVGTDSQKSMFLPQMICGEWTGTMCLTEPQAGSDLAAIRCAAEPLGDGTYRIKGQKIYVTYGEHDMTDNIVHLVLARLPNAPAGTRGISMFLVPRYRLSADGTPGAVNGVRCIGLEEKLGIHASPTATMSFGDAGDCIGTLLGGENEGLRNMFIMMNSARLDVGLQGVGLCERAFQRALAFAQDRQQGYAPGDKSGKQIPIIQHADVRRMLYEMKGLTLGGRAICYKTALAADMALAASDEATRRFWKAREDLLIPVAKAWCTDRANEVASLGVQVHGGMGFVEETGAAQYMRDARILAIYEGTNGIQAADLVGRKLLGDDGQAMTQLLAELATLADSAKSEEGLDRLCTQLGKAVGEARKSAIWLLAHGKTERDALGAVSAPFLRLLGNVVAAAALIEGTLKAKNQTLPHAVEMRRVSRFFADTYLSEVTGLSELICNQSEAARAIDPLDIAG